MTIPSYFPKVINEHMVAYSLLKSGYEADLKKYYICFRI